MGREHHELREVLDYSWWFIPSLVPLAAVLLALGLILLDEAVAEPPGLFAFSGSADAARGVLGTMNSSVLAARPRPRSTTPTHPDR